MSDGNRKGRLENLLKRAVELGVEKAVEAPDNLKSLVGELKLPKEIVSYLFTQVDDTKNGLLRVVAKETRDFLEHTNLAVELQKMLTMVQFEISTTVRFRPVQDQGDKPASADAFGKPEVKTEVNIKRETARERRRSRETGT